jgi:limonene-1,2-epoxide hydrolase
MRLSSTAQLEAAMNTEIAVRFNDAWERFDVDAIMGFFAEDATFHMMPTGKATGNAQIRKVVERILAPHQSAKFEILRWVEGLDGTVINERIDRFVRKDGKVVVIECVGVYEFANGKVTAWRDYFDMKVFADQMADYRPSASGDA